MLISENIKTVADIVNENPNAAIVFKKYQIDFCCKGKRPLDEVCKKQGLDPGALLDEISQLKGHGEHALRIHSWPMGMICDYIVHNHHSYVKATLPQLLQFAERVATVHGADAPETVEIFGQVQLLAAELFSHLKKEEEQLFPLIKKSEAQDNFKMDEWEALIDELKDEHSAAGDLIFRIAELSDNYTSPDWACNTYRALYHNLEAFQDDLFQHIHLENNVLFPKVMKRIAL